MRSDAIVIVADDYGIGPETSRGILELAETGRLSATVLLVNTPYSESAVAAWRRAGRPLELGWHPNLTLDRPILSAARIPSLVDRTGSFWSLGKYLMRCEMGLIRAEDVAAEWQAQYDRFCNSVGGPPRLVNSHQHSAIFGPAGRVLLDILERQVPKPFVRRIREPLRTIRRVGGGRIKRLMLTYRGRRLARESHVRGFPGCDMLAGTTSPSSVFDDRFFARWLNECRRRASRGATIELMCHPGHEDPTLTGRDCPAGVGVTRRVREYELLRRPEFGAALGQAGFRVATPDDFLSATANGSMGRAA